MNQKSTKYRIIAIITLSLSAAACTSAIAGAAEKIDSAPKDSASMSALSSAEKTDAECWQIAADNIDTLNFARAAILFGITRLSKPEELIMSSRRQTIHLDRYTDLELIERHGISNKISVFPTNSETTIERRLEKHEEPEWTSDTEYTYALPKTDKEYWTTIKANFKSLFGCSRQQIRKLLGPERCSSKSNQTMDYRIDSQRLRFYFTDGKVSFLKLDTDQYLRSEELPGSVSHSPINMPLWPIFDEKIDQILGTTFENYKALVSNYKHSLNFKSVEEPRHKKLTRKLSYTHEDWYLDNKTKVKVSMNSDVVTTIVFEPLQMEEDRRLPNGICLCGPDPGNFFYTERDTIHSGARRRDEAKYWAAIKPNLKNFIGMKRQMIAKLLGPERCYSKSGKTIDYRIGNSRLRFFLRNKVVVAFQLADDQYLHDT